MAASLLPDVRRVCHLCRGGDARTWSSVLASLATPLMHAGTARPRSMVPSLLQRMRIQTASDGTPLSQEIDAACASILQSYSLFIAGVVRLGRLPDYAMPFELAIAAAHGCAALEAAGAQEPPVKELLRALAESPDIPGQRGGQEAREGASQFNVFSLLASCIKRRAAKVSGIISPQAGDGSASAWRTASDGFLPAIGDDAEADLGDGLVPTRVLLLEDGEALLRGLACGRYAWMALGSIFAPGASKASAQHRAVLGLGPEAGPVEARALRRVELIASSPGITILIRSNSKESTLFVLTYVLLWCVLRWGLSLSKRSLDVITMMLVPQVRTSPQLLHIEAAGSVATFLSWLRSRRVRLSAPTAADVLVKHGSSLVGEKVLVTGACNGIGLAVARALLDACPDCRLMVNGRSMERVSGMLSQLPAHARSRCEAAIADLSSLREVDELCKKLAESPPDVVVCCAGIATLPRWTPTSDGYESQFAVNHLAHFHLVSSLVASGKHIRVVMVSSDLQRVGQKFLQIELDTINSKSHYSFIGNYLASKYCNVLFARSLHQRKVEAVSCSPGEVATEIDRYLPWLLRVVHRAFSRAQTPEQGAATVAYCMAADVVSGGFYAQCALTDLEGPAMEGKLWSFSERLVAAALERQDSLQSSDQVPVITSRCDGVILTPEAPARRLRCKTPPEQASSPPAKRHCSRTPSQHQVSAKKVQKDGTSKELNLNQVLQLIWLFAFGQARNGRKLVAITDTSLEPDRRLEVARASQSDSDPPGTSGSVIVASRDSESQAEAPRSRGARLQGTAGAKKPGPVAKPKQESQKFPLAAAGAAALAAAVLFALFQGSNPQADGMPRDAYYVSSSSYVIQSVRDESGQLRTKVDENRGLWTNIPGLKGGQRSSSSEADQRLREAQQEMRQTQAQVDQAMDEMNQEMASVFGSPMVALFPY
ncbi:Wwox [Symbiodinium sp. CCMP2456]|nr:Wwox [Symbiodinium sp. CCMP2456]